MDGLSKATGDDTEKVLHGSFDAVRKAIRDHRVSWEDFLRLVDDTMKPRVPVAEMVRGDFMPLLATFVKMKRDEQLRKWRTKS